MGNSSDVLTRFLMSPTSEGVRDLAFGRSGQECRMVKTPKYVYFQKTHLPVDVVAT
jgi:hypothetical protein